MLNAVELAPLIRILVYNPSQEVLPDAMLIQIIQTWIDIIGNEDKDKCSIVEQLDFCFRVFMEQRCS